MYRRPSRPNELYHWGMKKGEKAEDHKYVVRIEDGVTKAGTPKYRYFYSMAEYKAFKEGGSSNPIKDAAKGLKNFVDTKITGKAYYDKNKAAIEANKARTARENAQNTRQAARDLESTSRVRNREMYDAKYNSDGTIEKKYASDYHREANEKEDYANRTMNELRKQKQEYESNSLAGKAEKFLRQLDHATGMSKTINSIDKSLTNLQKDVRKRVNDFIDNVVKDAGKLTAEAASPPVPQYLPKAPDSVSSDPEDYAIKKKEIDPNSRSDDNRYTDEEIYKNLHESGAFDELSDYYEKLFSNRLGMDIEIGSDKDFQEVATYVETHATDESFSDIAQRQGWIDEKQEGFHPNSFSDLNKLEYDLDDDVDQYCVNSDNLNMNKEAGDVDVNGDGYPDVLGQYGYSNNCAYCTLAYEMRQRGYDVEASTCSQMTFNDENAIESWYEGGEFRHPNKAGTASLEKDILKHSPEGSRGQFCLFLANGGGHSVVYEVKGGEVYIRDCQVNKQWKLKDCPYMSRIDRRHPPIYMRTDHLKLTDKSLVGVKNR